MFAKQENSEMKNLSSYFFVFEDSIGFFQSLIGMKRVDEKVYDR